MCVRLYNCTIIETDKVKITKVYERPLVIPKSKGVRGIRGKASDPEKSLYNSLARAKRSIYEYAIANDWDFWATLTLDRSKIDRYSLDVIQKKLTSFLDNTRRTKHNGLRWLIVPEMHKDGAWHFHLLLAGLPDTDLRDTGRTYRDTGRKIYNWIDYEEKFGWNTLIDIRGVPLEEMYKIAKYLTKYMTKALGILRHNKKKYWSSKGLQRPKKTSTLISYEVYKAFMVEVLRDGQASDYIITENEYHYKDRTTGEVINTVYELVEVNMPF